ncbi:LVIVD repeat-containing protein [Cystobacter ferrugineus]|uniref:Lipoprotein n=1 Tax=Cystobacter ferrugineus TaxID=83449 RepID=A0A1L9BBZ4_9BACT|nr:hypothetical protein [Cystobacter ferrugineus]OJH39761.1 hypothetical protein BON30_17485 [Cystobacter ferrugineus]
MNRLLVAMAGALLPAWMGCANTESPETLGCASEDFDRSACDIAAVSAVKAEGIWQANVTLDGLDTPGALRLLPEGPLLFNTPLKERPEAGGPFFLSSEYTDSTVPLRLVLSACQAPEATRVTGEFRRCAHGAADLEGTFEAVRVQRLAGEDEASGVELVAEVPLPRGAVASDVFVSGGYAYVTAYADGLFVFDVRDPAAPQKIAEVTPSQDVWRRAWVKGQTLYIASAAQGLLVYDVGNPALPKRLSALPADAPVEAWGLYEDQERLYVMSPYPRAEVLIFDLHQDPTKPLLMKRYFVEDSLINQGELPVEGVVTGNRLYMGHWRYGFAVADVSNPNAPVTLGRFQYDKATSRPVAVGTIQEQTIAFEASEGWGSRVRVLNVTDPKNITQVGQFQTRPQSTVSAMTLVGTRLYVAYAQDGLRILDVSNPSTPRPQAYYNTWRESDPGRGRAFIDGLSAVKVPGDGYLYAAETSRGLLVLREQ